MLYRPVEAEKIVFLDSWFERIHNSQNDLSFQVFTLSESKQTGPTGDPTCATAAHRLLQEETANGPLRVE